METGRQNEGALGRWFVRAQRETLGPYSAEGILEALSAGDFLPSDRVLRTGETSWVPLEEHPFFASFEALVNRPRSDELSSVPSPRKLRIKPPPVRVERIMPRPLPAAIPVAAPVSVPAPVSIPAAAPIPEAPKPVEVTVEAKAEKKTPRRRKAKAAEAVVTRETISVAEPLRESSNSIGIGNDAGIGADDRDLLEAALALERALDRLPPERERLPSMEASPRKERAEPAISLPERPEIAPVFLAELPAPRAQPREPRVIRFELKLPERKLLVVLSLIAGIAACAGYHFSGNAGLGFPNKTRGQNGFRPSDPSSPTTSPLEAGDPIPPLKAPTRPQRE